MIRDAQRLPVEEVVEADKTTRMLAPKAIKTLTAKSATRAP